MLKYESTYRETYYNRFFLNAGSSAKLLASCSDIMENLDVFDQKKPDDRYKMRELFQWLSKSNNWLLLIDNVGQEEVDMIQRFLPLDAPGHVIFTSQRQLVVEKLTTSSHHCLLLDDLKVPEAVDIFLASSDYEPLPHNCEIASQIVNEIGLLPHTVDQVASYIKINNLDPDSFLDRYKRMPNRVWKHCPHF